MGAERFFSEHPWETGRTGPRAGIPRGSDRTVAGNGYFNWWYESGSCLASSVSATKSGSRW